MGKFKVGDRVFLLPLDTFSKKQLKDWRETFDIMPDMYQYFDNEYIISKITFRWRYVISSISGDNSVSDWYWPKNIFSNEELNDIYLRIGFNLKPELPFMERLSDV